MKDIYILGIESSCDETSASIVKNGKQEINTTILSQIDIHMLYGGVVPEIASRTHVKDITFVIDKCLKDSGLTIDKIDAIAVTYGPGLIGSLLVGIEAAKTLAYIYGKKLVPVHHIAGHIYANNLEKELEFPLISLVISGGHTDLIYMKDHLSYENIGTTVDDAVGECYDKVARVMNLPYPGGPKVDLLAREGKTTYTLPLPLKDDNYHFSFSGLKSAVINLIHNEKQKGNEIRVNDMCASFQEVVVQSLTTKTLKAMEERKVNNLILAGGVAANSSVREAFTDLCKKKGYSFSYPSIKYCSDNATMIAAAGYFLYKNERFSDLKLNGKSTDELR